MNFSQLHAWLNQSSLPRAIADFREHSFVAWNSTFLKQTGYSESRIKVIKPEDIIVFGDLRFQLPSGSNYPAAVVAIAERVVRKVANHTKTPAGAANDEPP